MSFPPHSLPHAGATAIPCLENGVTKIATMQLSHSLFLLLNVSVYYFLLTLPRPSSLENRKAVDYQQPPESLSGICHSCFQAQAKKGEVSENSSLVAYFSTAFS